MYPVAFDITHTDSRYVYPEVFRVLLDMGHVREGDLVIVTKGEFSGVAGRTNSMKILRVTRQ